MIIMASIKIRTSGRTTGRIGSDSFSLRVSSVVDITSDVLDCVVDGVVLGGVWVDLVVGLTGVVNEYRVGLYGVVLAVVGCVTRVDGGRVGLVGG